MTRKKSIGPGVNQMSRLYGKKLVKNKSGMVPNVARTFQKEGSAYNMELGRQLANLDTNQPLVVKENNYFSFVGPGSP